MNNLQDISSTTSVTWEGVYNTSKGEIEAKQLNLECQRTRSCTCDHARFSQFFLPFESLINILSNGVTNPIFFLHVTHFVRTGNIVVITVTQEHNGSFFCHSPCDATKDYPT